MPLAKHHRDLRVYQLGFEAAQRIFELSKQWPADERYALTSQIRRSSRSVCANIAEAWRKRRYEPNFVSKLSDADAEAAEAQTWLDFALASGYLERSVHQALHQQYELSCGDLVKMMEDAQRWCGPATLREASEPYASDAPSALDEAGG